MVNKLLIVIVNKYNLDKIVCIFNEHKPRAKNRRRPTRRVPPPSPRGWDTRGLDTCGLDTGASGTGGSGRRGADAPSAARRLAVFLARHGHPPRRASARPAARRLPGLWAPRRRAAPRFRRGRYQGRLLSIAPCAPAWPRRRSRSRPWPPVHGIGLARLPAPHRYPSYYGLWLRTAGCDSLVYMKANAHGRVFSVHDKDGCLEPGAPSKSEVY